MLFEYAVEPQAIGSSWENFRYLIEKFGFDRGRLISRFPGKWEKQVIQAAKDAGIPDIRMASIIERLRSVKSAVVDRERPYTHGQSWIDNAVAEHQRMSFHAIIAQQTRAGNEFVLSAADIDDQQPLMEACQDRSVLRESGAIAEALSAFLRSGSRIMFVDPFFDPYNARYKSTLRACLSVIKAYNPRAFCEIHYRHHENKPTNAELERAAANLFNGVIPEGLAISVFCWREKQGGADFHARYLLTDRGGVGIDAGFSAEGAHQATDMHLMSFALSEARLNAFARDATEFELIEPVLEIQWNGSFRRV